MNIFKLNNQEAKDFLLKQESYFDVLLPSYFNIEPIFRQLNTIQKIKINYQDILLSDNLHIDLYNIKSNGTKRPLTLINPVLYHDFVCQFTQDNVWQAIVTAFNFYKKQKHIACSSLPIVKGKYPKDKANQILYWWQNFEQKSISLNLHYTKQYHTDIKNFYPSIELKSIQKTLKSLNISSLYPICKNIIKTFKNKSIVQGSLPFHLLAELFLLNIDKQLFKILKKHQIKDYQILRYRDDYRIFANDEQVIDLIKNQLENLLNLHGVYFNNDKTFLSDDIIFDSVKLAKHDWILYENAVKHNHSLQQNLLLLYRYGNMHPNGTGIVRGLMHIRQQCQFGAFKDFSNIQTIISSLLAIIYKNQNYSVQGFALLADIIDSIKDNHKHLIQEHLNIVYSFFENKEISCTSKIWLQRFMLGFNNTNQYQWDNILCQMAEKHYCYAKIWDFEWINKKSIKNIVKNQSFITEKELSKQFENFEVDLFYRQNKSTDLDWFDEFDNFDGY